MFGYLISILMGAEIATQSAVNTKLKRAVGSPYLASTISFFVGTLFLSLILLVMRPALMLTPQLILHHPWWMWLGGFTSAFALTVNVLLFTRLGSVQTAVLPIVGQIIMSVVIDGLGLFQATKTGMNVLKAGSLFLLLLGAMLSANVFVKKSPIEQDMKRQPHRWLWQLIGIIAGGLLAVQAAVNGYLGQTLHSATLAAWVTCLVAFCCLLVVDFVVKVPIVLRLRQAGQMPKANWWMWLGGLLGSSYVLLSAQLVPILGTEIVIIMALFGQLAFSALIDNFGWLAAPKQPVLRLQYVGLGLMLIAIIGVNMG